MLGVAVVIILLATFFASRAAKKPAAVAAKPNAEKAAVLRTISTQVVENQAVKTKVSLFGRLISVEKIDIYAEVNAALLASSPNLRAGQRIAKGGVLLRMDAAEQTLTLQAQRSALLTSITQIMPDIKIDFADNLEAWESYRRAFDVTKAVPALPVPKTERERDFIALKTINNQYYTIKSGEERLTKYTVVAPFSGEITESLISTGSYIRAGQKLATLMNTGVYELEAAVALEDLKYIKVGDVVQLQAEEGGAKWTGRIARIANSIDTKSQTLKAYIQVSGSGLRENMFLTGYTDAMATSDVVELPRRLLVGGDKIYIYQPTDSTLRLLPVQVVRQNTETVLLRGIANGQQVLKELATGIFEGQKVQLAK
jgi:multidrug efflux pump subunit AcrA (membrane-fusion protein)